MKLITLNETDQFDEVSSGFATLPPDIFKQRMNEMLESHPNEESKKFWEEYTLEFILFMK